MNECTYSTSHFVHREKSNEGIAGWLTVDFDGKLASSSLIHTMQKFLRSPVSVFFSAFVDSVAFLRPPSSFCILFFVWLQGCGNGAQTTTKDRKERRKTDEFHWRRVGGTQTPEETVNVYI